MARLSIRSRLLCAAGAILLLSSVPAAHLASVQGHNDVIRNLDNTISPDDGSAARRGSPRRRWAGRGQYGARPPNCTDITGTAPIKEITVTGAVTVSVTRLPSAHGTERLMAGPKSRSGAAL
jgi:hypothetical protein